MSDVVSYPMDFLLGFTFLVRQMSCGGVTTVTVSRNISDVKLGVGPAAREVTWNCVYIASSPDKG